MKHSKLRKTHKIPRIKKRRTHKKKKGYGAARKQQKEFIWEHDIPSTIPEEKSKELMVRLDSVSAKHKRNRTRMTQLGNVMKRKGETRGGGKTRRKHYR